MSTPYLIQALLFSLMVVTIGNGCWLGTRSLFPKFVERSSQRWKVPILDFIVGGVLGFALIGLTDRLLHGEPGEPLDSVVSFVKGIPVLVGLIGLSGLAARVGAGLKAGSDDPRSWRSMLRGGVVLGLLCGFPLWGQGLFLFLLAGGFGNAILSLRGKSGGKGEQKRLPGRPLPRSLQPDAEREREAPARRNRPARRGRGPRGRDERGSGRSETARKPDAKPE